MDQNEQNWNREAHYVADMLDRGNPNEAANRLRDDLFRLQEHPREQQEFLTRVSQYDHKGQGADLQLYRGQEGSLQYNVIPPRYGYDQRQPYNYDNRYDNPQGYRPDYYPQQNDYRYQPQPYPYQVRPYYGQSNCYGYDRDPGAALVDGLATGAGLVIGSALMGRAFGGGHHENYYEMRGRHRR
jgi:hypothetical protein